MIMLLCMGFLDFVIICKVLCLVKNDINEVVVLFINEWLGFDYGGYEFMDSGGGFSFGFGGGLWGDGGGDGGGGFFCGGSIGGGGGFDFLFVYYEVVDVEKNDENGNCLGEGIEFFIINLYELESCVLIDYWFIFYK